MTCRQENRTLWRYSCRRSQTVVRRQEAASDSLSFSDLASPSDGPLLTVTPGLAFRNVPNGSARNAFVERLEWVPFAVPGNLAHQARRFAMPALPAAAGSTNTRENLPYCVLYVLYYIAY